MAGQTIAEAWPPSVPACEPACQGRIEGECSDARISHQSLAADVPARIPATVGRTTSFSGVIVCTWGQLPQLGEILCASPHLMPTNEALQIIVVPGGSNGTVPTRPEAGTGSALNLTRMETRSVEHAVACCPRDDLYRPTPLAEGELELDPGSCRVTRRGRPIQLKRTEFRILYALMCCRGAVLSRSQLLSMVWLRPSVEMRTIDVHIRRLRLALNGPGEPDLIRTVRGLGYALAE